MATMIQQHDLMPAEELSIASTPVEAIVPTPVEPARYFRFSGWLWRAVGLFMLLMLSPLILVSIVFVRLTSSGPAIYSQIRVGRNGRLFRIYKIRSMRLDAEKFSGAVWTTSERDPRITRLGRFLRRTHLDELPQLWNVVRGDMALVGPRPERPEFTEHLAKSVPNYADRLLVLPGITGLAQINLEPDTDLDSVRRKTLVDLDYVQTGSLGMDLRIVLCTACQFMRLPRSIVLKSLGLGRTPLVAELEPTAIPDFA